MRSAECNGGSQTAGCVRRDGTLWFPTIKGVVRVDPAHMPTNQRRPPVAVEELFVDQKPAASRDPLRLPAGAQALELHYTALSLRAPQRVNFKYRLVGFDPKTEKFLDITPIPSGGGTIRHMMFDPRSGQIWFGSDNNTIGRAQVREAKDLSS